MDEIKAVIADDEAPLRRFLRRRLSEVWPELVICGEAQNGLEAVELIERHRPHIAFLDIKMPGLSGMEVAGKIAGPCRVVFVTAYDEYAVEAFEKEAVDYLLKPVSGERLEKTVRRLKEEISAGVAVPAETLERLRDLLSQGPDSGRLRHIRVQHGDGVRLIPVEEVIYFKAEDKYTRVITREGESLIRKPIRELGEELDPERFWQIHRGTIVNVRSILRVSRSLTGTGVLKLKDRAETLKVSQGYMHLFRQM
ncbi:MAG: response regulator transcription factor [Deltaproteobacteria bacterium]|nr:response regulator transcription factor [Deltaproteobacteria bacterium]